MKIKLLAVAIGLLVISAFIIQFGGPAKADDTPKTVSLTTDVQEYLTWDFVPSSPEVDFGNLTPGTAIPAPSGGVVASVTTNAANGYSVGLHDGSGTNSALLHTDESTYIADYAGTITTPTTWTGTGIGITLFAADTTKEAKWGTGTTYNDVNNKYAGIPAESAVAHTAATYKASADTSTWAFKIDVPNTQKTGTYGGNVTFTVTAALT